MPFKSEKQRKWMWANNPEMAKKWEKKEKKMKRVKELIKKMVREELAKMNEDFAGAYPKGMRKKFDNKRRKQSEVLGYTLTGKDDIKTEIDDATIKEGKGVDKVLDMANNNSFGKLAGKTVDAMSANLFKQVYEKSGSTAKAKIDKMSEKQIYGLMIKIWNKFGKQVKL